MARFEESKLDEVLQEIMDRWGLPGLAASIINERGIQYARTFGVQSLETCTPVQPDSIFCVASVSKCFVASAMMQLVECGKVQLDAPVVQYLPYFQLDDERSEQVTIRQVLCHTSGLPDIDENEYDRMIRQPETDDAAIERFVRSLKVRKMVAAPGERFSYSNIGYNVLGHLIYSVSGRTFEAYMQEHVLHPAGMAESSFLLADVDWSRLAVPHLLAPQMIVNPVYPYHRADAPSSFLHTTLIDMCHWATACLNKGAFAGQRFLSPASYEQMWTPVAWRGYPPFYIHGGLSWNIGQFEGTRAISHGGMGMGWADFLVLLPEKNLAAVILCNAESFARERLVVAVTRAALRLEPHAGTVSWMVPVCQALQAGGIQAADERCIELMANGGEEYIIDPHDLVNLTYQLQGAGKLDLAIDVLKLNLRAFPGDPESQERLASLDR